MFKQKHYPEQCNPFSIPSDGLMTVHDYVYEKSLSDKGFKD